jgi:AraC-like DNA-binding protein
MSDFASAAMLRLIHRSLQLQGLPAPALAPPRGALVPLDAKRMLAQALWQAHGPDVLVRIGGAARDGHEPLMAALAPAQDPPDLVRRWQRLEGFIHSRHRIVVVSRQGQGMELRHRAADDGAPPAAAEDLLVFGVLIALLERCGTRELQARLMGERRWRWQQQRWFDHPWPQDLGAWELRWSDHHATAPEPLTPVHDWPERVRAQLATDLGRDWSLAVLARALQTSPRSLQRQMASAQISYSVLLAEVRASRAGELLSTTDVSPAEIGYVCGYADQAHFTREFKRQTALTPASFRRQFAARGG